MSDYIKKEDAMKAICKRCLIENDICQHHWNCPYLGEISQVTAIEVVPKDFHDKTCEAMAKRHTEEIQKFMWIPCSERLPREYSDGERVLATTDVDGLGVIIMPIYDVKSWYRKGYISAWMPLPKPYEEREDE